MDVFIDKDDRDKVLDQLEWAGGHQMNWAVFDTSPGSVIDQYVLRWFQSQQEAEAFCERGGLEISERYEDFDRYHDYQYVSIAQMRSYVMGIPETYLGLDISANEVAQMLKRQDLHLLYDGDAKNLLDHFQNGLFSPVVWIQEVDPRREISEFHIVQQRPIGQPWNHGEIETERPISFASCPVAKAALNDLAVHSAKLRDDINYLLIGSYRGHQPTLHTDGRPTSHTGTIIDRVYWQYEIGLAVSAWQEKEQRDWKEPALIQKYFFAAYDRVEQSIRLLNGERETVTPKMGEPLVYPGFYKNNLLTTKSLEIMNHESYQFNADQMKYLGFGEDLQKELHTKMDQNLAEFTLNHSRDFGKDQVESVLHFSKGDDLAKDLTFFNRFDSTLKKEGLEDLTQTFFVGPKYNYTLQERYNMMDGRAAFREQPKMEPVVGGDGQTKMKPTGETYTAWRQLDFKSADNFGNFNPKVFYWDHEKELKQYPIKGIEENYDRSRIMRQLEKGNKTDVVLVRNGEETAVKVVANPRMTRLEFFDSDGKSLVVRREQKQAVDQSQKAVQTPRQVQQAAIARGEALKHQQGQSGTNAQQQNQNAGPVKKTGESQGQQQSEAAKEKVAEEQDGNKNRRRQGVRI